MSRFDTNRSGQPSQRQLRVGELVRHAVAEIFTRGEAGADLDGLLLSIAEVRMSPDLKHALVLVAPLASPDAEAVVEKLNRAAPWLRGRVAPALRQLRSVPDLRFRLDTRFDDDSRIDEILRSPDVARDLGGDGDDS